MQPGSIWEQSGQIFKDDCIYSVNGISLNGISHPQALQILKQCSTNAKIVLFRDKSKDNKLLEEVVSTTAARVKLPSTFPHKQGQSDPLPGTIANEIKYGQVRPTLHRRTTNNSSLINIPVLNGDDNNSKESSPAISKRNRQSSHTRSLSVPARSDGDESSGDNSSNPGTPAPLPKIHAVNKRSNVGAFVIEYEKFFKGLGVDVMMDELGVCYITNILQTGVIGNDDRIR